MLGSNVVAIKVILHGSMITPSTMAY